MCAVEDLSEVMYSIVCIVISVNINVLWTLAKRVVCGLNTIIYEEKHWPNLL